MNWSFFLCLSFIKFAASVKALLRWLSWTPDIQSSKKRLPQISPSCAEGHLGFSVMPIDAENLPGFTSGASFGNLSKVNVPAAGWWRLFLTGEFFWDEASLSLWWGSHVWAYFYLSAGSLFCQTTDNAKQPDRLGGNTNNFRREILTWHHLASGIFSPRIRCPVRSGLKLPWHDWLKCDQSKKRVFWQFNQLKEYSHTFVLFGNKWFSGVMPMKGNVRRYYPSETGSEFKSSVTPKSLGIKST